jgi:uncharacterized protein YlxP (DUF503 family)
MEPQVGLLVVELLIPGAQTLKEKRQVVRSLLDRALARFNVASAEIDHLDRHGRALLAFVTVANQAQHVHEVLGAVRQLVESEPRAEIVAASLQLL